jgi:hypothetical protein
MSGKELFDKVAESISADHPSFKIRYKDESRLMRLIALLISPFNEGFAEQYTTTLGSTVYFPNRAAVEGGYGRYAEVLAHEGVHIFDDARQKLWFKLSYSLNQSLVLPLLVLYAVLGSWIPVAALFGGVAIAYVSMALLKKIGVGRGFYRGIFFAWAGLAALSYLGAAVWFSHWWTILAVAAMAPLIPISSVTRAKWEYRGYALSIAFEYWRTGTITDRELEWTATHFTGPDYYYMDRDAKRVAAKLQAIKSSILDGSILTGADAHPYRRTLDALKALNLVKPGAVSA